MNRQIKAGRLFFAMISLLILLQLYGCRTTVPISGTDTVRIETERLVLKDTTVYMTDSASLYAYLYCDSLNQARIGQIDRFLAGQFVRPKVVLKDNFLKIDCKIDSAAIGIRWVERYGTRTQYLTVRQVEKVNFVTGWQWFQIWIGRIAIAAGVIVALYYSIKSTWWAILLSWAVKLMRKVFTKKK